MTQQRWALFFTAMGVTVLAIAALHLVLGPGWQPGIGEYNATMASQHRFYAAMFGVVGGGLYWVGQDVPNRATFGRAIAWFFLAGAAGRVLSFATHGQPHWFYLLLLGVEIVGPAIVLLGYTNSTPAEAHGQRAR